jgi:hypothetical protein
VAHEQKRVDVWSRGQAGWTVEASGSGERASLKGIGGTLDVDSVYRDPLNG